MSKLASFKIFIQKRDKSFLPLPTWFTNGVYNEVRELIDHGNKLEVCRFLMGQSKDNNTREIYNLKWSKVEIVDEIQSVSGISILPTTSPVAYPVLDTPSQSEIANVLHPFYRLAQECLHNSNLHKDQIVYAYNKAQITMQDLRNIEALILKLTK